MIDTSSTITMEQWIVTRQLYMGIAIGGTKTSLLIGDTQGRIFFSRTFTTKPYYVEVLADIDTEIHHFIELAKSYVAEPLQAIQAIGISCGGPLDPVTGTINNPPNLPSWNNVSIVEYFYSRYHIDCYLENDANAGVLAEWFWGNGKGCSHLLYLTFGTGLGAGMILNGELYTGASYLAGEVGHVRMSKYGPVAYGKTGSWEGYCSGAGLTQLYAVLHGGSNLSAKEICDLAETGDEKALAVVRTSSKYLGRGLAMLIDILNPEKIIIGSIFTKREKLFRSIMEEYLKLECLASSYARCEVVTSGLGTQLDEKGALASVVYHKNFRKSEMEHVI